jgi:hypothetical protein
MWFSGWREWDYLIGIYKAVFADRQHWGMRTAGMQLLMGILHA